MSIEKIVRIVNKNPICGVYQITNEVNGKIYIGQSINIERRWEQHKYGKGNIILKNAFKKYGVENFEFKILEEITFTNRNEVIEKLTEIEQKWFDSEKPYLKENGYNLNTSAKPNIPTKRDDDFGKRISKIKIDNNHCGKVVKQYSLKGIFLKEWMSAAQIERVLGFKSENISACCLYKSNSSNGFIWTFGNKILTNDRINEANRTKRLSEVRQYNLKGELLNTFKNVLDASDKTKIRKNIIRSSCSGTRKTGAGFIWKFKNEPLILIKHLKLKDLPINQLSKNNELIMRWDNISHALKELGISKDSRRFIYKSCRKNVLYKNHLWEWTT